MPRTHPGLCRAVCRCGLPGLRELPLTLYDPLSDPGRAELPAPFPSCTAFSQVCRWVAHSCRVKTTLSWTPGKFSPDLCRRGKNDSSWETRGSHLLRWVKMRSPVASKSRRTGWGSSWVLLVRSRRSWALGVCASGEVGGLDQRGFILGAEARCSRGLWPDTEVRNTATPNFHCFFFLHAENALGSGCLLHCFRFCFLMCVSERQLSPLSISFLPLPDLRAYGPWHLHCHPSHALLGLRERAFAVFSFPLYPEAC